MANLSYWGSSQLLNSLFGKTQSIPDAFYLALMTGDAPDAFSSGEGLEEPERETGYTRLLVPNTGDVWGPTGFDSVGNIIDLEFPPALSTWGAVRSYALLNAETDGDIYIAGELDEIVQIDALDEFYLPAGSIVFAAPFGLQGETDG